MLLVRYKHAPDYTAGVLLFKGETFYTLERAGEDSTTANSEKRIKEGTYAVTDLRDRLVLHSVPGRSGIQIHVGNTIKDSVGCILVGLSRNGDGSTIFHSRDAMARLKQLRPYQITIKNGG